MPFEYDDSQWPITILTAIDEASSDEVIRYLEIQDKVLERKQPHVLIWDARQAKMLEPMQRKRLSTWILENKVALGEYRIGFAFVSSSLVIRGFLKAVHWVTAPPFPTKLFKELEDALTWAKKILADVKRR
jgi:hypothetical protein